MEVKVQLIKMDPKDCEAEIRRVLDDLNTTARDEGISFSFGPKGGKKGPYVKMMGEPERTVRFGKVDMKPEALPKLDAYTSGWACKKQATNYTNTNLPFACKCSVNPEVFYNRLALKLLNRDIELQPKRFRLQNDNVIEVAAIAPASATLDTIAISLWFLTHHKVYVHFTPAKVNRETHSWKESYFNSDEVDGMLCVCLDDDLATIARLCKTLWPVKGQHRDLSTYPAGVKGSAFLFDGNGKIHKRYREKFSLTENDGTRVEGHLLYKNMHEEYAHSRHSPEDNGGRITVKLIRNVDSLTTPITKLSGETTCLRTFLSSTVDPVSGKKMFPSMKPAPTKGNKKGVLTVLTTYRAGNLSVRKDIALRAKEFLTGTLINKVWAVFGETEASKVLSTNICQRLTMEQGVDLDDILGDDSEFIGMDLLMDMDDADEGQLDNMSLQSAWANSAVTTQSTRDRLRAKEDELKEMEANITAKDEELQEQRLEKERQSEKISNMEKQQDAITAQKDAEIAELMRRLEAAMTGAHQTLPNQSNQPECARAPLAQAVISPPRPLNSFRPMETLPNKEDATTHATPTKVSVVGD